MRPCSALYRRLAPRLAFVLPLLAMASACNREEAAAPSPDTAQAPAPKTPAATATPAGLDLAALLERNDPARVLRFYAAALAAGEWSTAAHAWGEDTGTTGDALQAEFGAKGPVTLEPGIGQTDGAAGSLYYEAPVVLRFKDGEERKGTITLRRVNGVDGASDEQLRWHIERSSFGPVR